MNRFPYRSNDRLGSQQPSPSGSPAPTAISFVAHVLPPSKLTPSNIPAVSPASPWPTLVTVTMLAGLVGLTAIVSSDSFRCRWLTSTLAGVAAPGPTRATASAVGVAASAAAISTATTTIENRKRYMAGLLPARCHHEGYAGRHRRERAQHARTKSASRAGSCLHAASRPQLAAGSGRWPTHSTSVTGRVVTWCDGPGRLTVLVICWGLSWPSFGVSARTPEVPYGHHDPIRCPRPGRACLHQHRTAGISRVPRRVQRPDPPGLRAGLAAVRQLVPAAPAPPASGRNPVLAVVGWMQRRPVAAVIDRPGAGPASKLGL